MPKAVHDKLVREANKKGFTGKRKDAYVYSVLNKIEGKQSPKKPSKPMKW